MLAKVLHWRKISWLEELGLEGKWTLCTWWYLSIDIWILLLLLFILILVLLYLNSLANCYFFVSIRVPCRHWFSQLLSSKCPLTCFFRESSFQHWWCSCSHVSIVEYTISGICLSEVTRCFLMRYLCFSYRNCGLLSYWSLTLFVPTQCTSQWRSYLGLRGMSLIQRFEMTEINLRGIFSQDNILLMVFMLFLFDYEFCRISKNVSC